MSTYTVNEFCEGSEFFPLYDCETGGAVVDELEEYEDLSDDHNEFSGEGLCEIYDDSEEISHGGPVHDSLMVFGASGDHSEGGGPCLLSDQVNSENLVKCIFCDNHINICESRDSIFYHFLHTHKFIIQNSNTIADLRAYIDYWRQRFITAPITEFCSIIKTDAFTANIPTNYYLLSDDLPEDLQLRQSLQRVRLETVLNQSEIERAQTDLKHDCIFCHHQLEGTKAMVLNHFADEHNFNLGHPENIVYIEHLLSTLASKLDFLQCLYCEKYFKDVTTLKEHMRKKQHRKLHPKNQDYDKYYIINYLEIGKSWSDIMEEDDTHMWRDLRREENVWDDWKEENYVLIKCLFCSEEYVRERLECHMLNVHNFNFHELIVEGRGFYEQVSCVSYIRNQVFGLTCPFCHLTLASQELLLDHFTSTNHTTMRLPSDVPNFIFSHVPQCDDPILQCLHDPDDEYDVFPVKHVYFEDVSESVFDSLLSVGLENIDEDKLRRHSVTTDDAIDYLPGALANVL